MSIYIHKYNARTRPACIEYWSGYFKFSDSYINKYFFKYLYSQFLLCWKNHRTSSLSVCSMSSVLFFFNFFFIISSTHNRKSSRKQTNTLFTVPTVYFICGKVQKTNFSALKFRYFVDGTSSLFIHSLSPSSSSQSINQRHFLHFEAMLPDISYCFNFFL